MYLSNEITERENSPDHNAWMNIRQEHLFAFLIGCDQTRGSEQNNWPVSSRCCFTSQGFHRVVRRPLSKGPQSKVRRLRLVFYVLHLMFGCLHLGLHLLKMLLPVSDFGFNVLHLGFNVLHLMFHGLPIMFDDL